MTQPPIVPGPYDPSEGWEPTAPQPPVPPGYYPPQSAPPVQPVPVYYPHPPAAPSYNPGRAAGNTVVVVLTLFGLLCVLPTVLCFVFGAFGSLANR